MTKSTSEFDKKSTLVSY